ncbi:uncharacterized protein JN550_006987 [Neoarthrinium moseri]|nr:uncharacterized protein JN550_006987 [Neoarthrinium moseri]KAI1867256.1 hypothetical protein JN550_006987 [Neoarthrinium moseri]
MRMDPLVAAAFHNQNCSTLCRLPEELLIKVMAYIDGLGVQCLRRTCRVFLRLYSSPRYIATHDLNAKHTSDFLPWSQPVTGFSAEDKLSYLLINGEEGYCAGCQDVRGKQSFDKKMQRITSTYMHCSGCRVDHPVGLFSASQRKAPNKTRICIGREGLVRLCDHRTMSWTEISSIVSRLRRFESGSNGRTIYISCKDESHVPAHHRAGFSKAEYQIYPTFIVAEYSNGGIYLELDWTGHLPISSTGRGERTTPSFMRSQLENLRAGAAEFIAPESPLGQLPEMSCFDPNRCNCLDYSGVEHLSHSWQLTPPEEIDFLTCRSRRNFKLVALGPSKNTACVTALEKQPGGHCTLRNTTRLTNGEGQVRIIIDSCAKGSPCLQVEYWRRIEVANGLNPNDLVMTWYQALDPDSYNLTEDEEFHGVLWCRQRGCRNYYRYMKKVLVPHRALHRVCGEHCLKPRGLNSKNALSLWQGVIGSTRCLWQGVREFFEFSWHATMKSIEFSCEKMVDFIGFSCEKMMYFIEFCFSVLSVT